MILEHNPFTLQNNIVGVVTKRDAEITLCDGIIYVITFNSVSALLIQNHATFPKLLQKSTL